MSTVLITGANRGIGLALARQYAVDGWRVLATCREPRGAGALADLKGDISVDALAVTDFDGIEALARKLAGEPIDVLFNNAGIVGRGAGTLGQIEPDAWAEAFAVNVIGPIKIAEAFVEHVAASDRKKMAFVTSRLGSIASNLSGGRYAYNSSKAALNMACKSLSVDLARRGIAVVVMHPGHVATDMGGAGAPVTPDASAAGMRRVVADLTSRESGAFINYDGAPIPW